MRSVYERMCGRIMDMYNAAESADYSFDEILRLHDMLRAAGVPHRLYRWVDGYQLVYWYKAKQICSVVENSMSIGGKDDLLEIMGMLKPEEYEQSLLAYGLHMEFVKKYSIKGNLTAEDVFERIRHHWSTHRFEAVKYMVEVGA